MVTGPKAMTMRRKAVVVDSIRVVVADDSPARAVLAEALRAEVIEAVLLCADGASTWNRHHRQT